MILAMNLWVKLDKFWNFFYIFFQRLYLPFQIWSIFLHCATAMPLHCNSLNINTKTTTRVHSRLRQCGIPTFLKYLASFSDFIAPVSMAINLSHWAVMSLLAPLSYRNNSLQLEKAHIWLWLSVLCSLVSVLVVRISKE